MWMLAGKQADRYILSLFYKGDNEVHMVDEVCMLCMISVESFSAHNSTFWPERNVNGRGKEEQVADMG